MGKTNFKYDEFEESNDSTNEERFLLVRKMVIEAIENPKLAVDELFIKAIVDFKCGDYENSLGTIELIGDIISNFENWVWIMLESRNVELSGNIFPFLRRRQNN